MTDGADLEHKVNALKIDEDFDFCLPLEVHRSAAGWQLTKYELDAGGYLTDRHSVSTLGSLIEVLAVVLDAGPVSLQFDGLSSSEALQLVNVVGLEPQRARLDPEVLIRINGVECVLDGDRLVPGDLDDP
jgi:hypothetical protein